MRNPKTQLEAAIQRFFDLYDFAPIAYVSFDRAGRIDEANLAVTELLGVSRDLLIGRPFALYVADLDLFMRHLLKCRISQQRTKTELQLKSKKGERIPALLYSTPINSTTRNGALLYQTAIVDLTERKRFEQELQRSEERYRTLFDLVPVAVYVCDAGGVRRGLWGAVDWIESGDVVCVSVAGGTWGSVATDHGDGAARSERPIDGGGARFAGRKGLRADRRSRLARAGWQ